MVANVILFTDKNKLSHNELMNVSSLIRRLFKYEITEYDGKIHVVVNRSKDVEKVTRFCYGMREMLNILTHRED